MQAKVMTAGATSVDSGVDFGDDVRLLWGAGDGSRLELTGVENPKEQVMNLFDKHGGYRKLDSFTLATVIQLGTWRFCERFLDRIRAGGSSTR